MDYPSKRDAWLVSLCWGSCLLVLVVVARALPAVEAGAATAGSLLASLATCGFVLWVVYGTGYRFDGDDLRIRSGPFRMRVPLARIESVEPTRNPLSSPACSLDRLRIRFGERSVMSSPRERARFLDELALRCPGLRRIGC